MIGRLGDEGLIIILFREENNFYYVIDVEYLYQKNKAVHMKCTAGVSYGSRSACARDFDIS